MKKLLFVCLLLVGCMFDLHAERPHNYLYDKWRQEGPFISDTTRLKSWHEAEKRRWQKEAEALPEGIKRQIIEEAKKDLSCRWPALSAMSYLDFSKNGNRRRFESEMFSRRYALSRLVTAYFVTKDKKYLPPLVNGLWATLEETTWTLPAHLGAPLPSPEKQVLDLFDAETGAMVALTGFLLQDELKDVSPLIVRRIDYELNRRIIQPYLQGNYGWMGFSQGSKPNNWNPWINSNVLTVMLYHIQEVDTINKIFPKLLRSVDNFINPYNADGGCDEGPGYWNEAGGALVRILYLLQAASEGRWNFRNEQVLDNMAAYIYKVHIKDHYYVNFADAPARVTPGADKVFEGGKYFGDPALIRFGKTLLSEEQPNTSSVMDFLFTLHAYGDTTNVAKDKRNTKNQSFYWLPDLQVLTAKTMDEDLFFAAKGGNNAESHNHNDVGNFILYVKGYPVLVDAGSGDYTAVTFSSKRYTLWNMQSDWHNCPDINGQMQKDGAKYKATDVSFSNRTRQVSFAMDLAQAYPREAAVESWKRSFLFDQGKKRLKLTEDYRLKSLVSAPQIHFLCAVEPRVKEEGVVDFVSDDKTVLRCLYDKDKVQAFIEEKIMNGDETLSRSWGSKLYELTFKVKGNDLNNHLAFVFEK